MTAKSRGNHIDPRMLEALYRGEPRATARLISLVENDPPGARELIRLLYPRTGGAHVIGVTGPPGSGKSTLIDRLALEYRRRGKTVAVLAVDVSSPFTGGAFLGDRIRMQGLTGDPGIYVRSMGSRGALGGLAKATRDAIKVLDASGRQVILVETIGTGQDEVEIIHAAHTILLVAVPGLGDEIQAIKAGTMEIADLYVVNKADRDGADRTVAELRGIVDMGKSPGRLWEPPVLTTVALEGTGVPGLADALGRHLQFLRDGGGMGAWQRRALESEVMDLLRDRLQGQIGDIRESPEYKRLLEKLRRREVDPHTVAERLWGKVQ